MCLEPNHQVELLTVYHEALCANGVENYPIDQCLHSFQRCIFSAMITPVLAAGDLGQGDERLEKLFSAMTRRCCMALEDWVSRFQADKYIQIYTNTDCRLPTVSPLHTSELGS
jgi:hypothetical protein